MTRVSTNWLTAIGAGFLMLAVTLMQGFWTDRWASRDDGGELALAAKALEMGFPEQFGEWKMQEVIAADPQELARAGAVGAVSRTYRHAGSNVLISAFVVCAAPHDASGHTPDRCYPGAGFQIGEAEHRHEVRLPDGDEVEAFTGTFIKGGQTLRIFWTYGVPRRSDTNRPNAQADVPAEADATPALSWIAPTIARIALNGERAVYKLYVIIDQTTMTGTAAMSAGSDFLSAVLPAFDERLVQARRAADTDAAQRAAPSAGGDWVLSTGQHRIGAIQ